MATEIKQPASISVEVPAAEEFVCDYGEDFWLACRGLPFYKEHQGEQYCVLHYPGKEKSEDFVVAIRKKLEAKDFNFRGVWFPNPISFAGFEFSTNVFFDYAQFDSSVDFSQAKFAYAQFIGTNFGANVSFGAARFKYGEFNGVKFNEGAHFGSAEFTEGADFVSSEFGGNVVFGDVEFGADVLFNSAKFNGDVQFCQARFKATASFAFASFQAVVDFNMAKFGADAEFGHVEFGANADFSMVKFGANADFSCARFGATVDFSSSTFGNYACFGGQAEARTFEENALLNLANARIEKPERISFHTLMLRPHWFVNVDTRKFEFANVKWDDKGVRDEIDSLCKTKIEYPHSMLAIAYRRLAVNAEENHHYGTASRFRYGSMEARRLETWHGWAVWKLHWWYWLASGYGERAWQAIIVLPLVLFLFACLYTQVGFTQLSEKTSTATVATSRDTIGKPLNFKQSLAYSFEVALLQKPEPKPLTLTARFLVGLETILGPLQGALLALAVRRKFMR